MAGVAFACRAAAAPSPGSASLAQIDLPPGFEIGLFSSEVPGARSLTLGAKGTVFVGTREGRVYAVVDRDQDGAADQVFTIARGLAMPNGVAFRKGALYVAEIGRVLRYDAIEDHLPAPPAPVPVVEGLPTERHHGWKFIAFGPDDLLYVPVGAPCNVCESSDPRFASILRFHPDGTPVGPMARGVRNTVGFDWEPGSGVLWFTDNGRDLMGDNIPPDELNQAAVPGRHFGFPYCHGGTIPDPAYAKGRNCRMFEPPAIALGPHVAALGMRFYRGAMFPPEYRGQIFIAEHGSWNRSDKIGYRVTLVKVAEGRALTYQPFATGWLQGEQAWGRPVDVQEQPDGSMLVSDDQKGAIYRITYTRP
ncbi:MAG TPA: PQQ-dependent sugar dehydrogenase [Vicinamibacteria bacterium]|nr:PQQ-dependent sugar dehydrogenase [Vicinamibacteria bacterium]